MKVLYALLLILPFLVSCQKELSELDSTNTDSSSNNNNNQTCNNNVLKLKRWKALYDSTHHIDAEWNADGSIKKLKMNVPLSEYRTAIYAYQNGRIKEAELRDNNTNVVYDTVLYHYNAAGKVDSMYQKNNDWFNIKLTYTNGKLTRYTRYTGTDVMFYWDITTDGNDNIIGAIEYDITASGPNKTSTYTWTRDSKKNPLANLAPYMFHLDDDYNIFWYWGANNFVDQRYIDHAGTGIDITSGYKFKYNNDCYPLTSQNTVQGMTLFPDDDFLYTYY